MKYLLSLCLWLLTLPGAFAFDLVVDGESPVPIVLAAEAPPASREAAEELAHYLERICGVRPALLTTADPTPASAIWVGLPLPGETLALTGPEEIRIACDGQHLSIAGRDRLIGEVQVEAGTANAVYTFLQDWLGVRWLWPGELGEDVPSRPTLRFEPFKYRYQPPFLQRDLFMRAGGALRDWTRRQRSMYDSLEVSAGHAFSDWWDRFHVAHPDYFALQPDGTRSGFPSPHNAKLCQSNPAVWQQWLKEVERDLQQSPTQRIFNAAPNDGSNQGLCVCETCRAWDHPDGRTWRYSWAGHREEYPAATDRYLTFTNHLAALLAERYPEREFLVSQMAYGPGKPPPITTKLAENVVVGYVGHFPIASEGVRERERAEWQEWAELAPKLVFRPNLFWYSGGMHGMPVIATADTAADFRFLAEHSGVGLIIDTMPRHWATQGPQLYLMTQLAWNPHQDTETLMADYYQRGFGPAAEPVAAYFALMEAAFEELHNTPGWRPSMGAQFDLVNRLQTVLSEERLAQANELLQQAAEAARETPFQERVAFVRTGLDFVELQVRLYDLMDRVRDSGGKDREAVEQALQLDEQRNEMFGLYDGIALDRWFNTYARVRGAGRGLMITDLAGPPSQEHQEAAGLLQRYRWTGAAGDGFWASSGNWERQESDQWIAAETPPDRDDYAILGDAAPDAPQLLTLSYDTEVGRLIMAATGQRRYTIANMQAGAYDHLDADSGMLYRLLLTDEQPVVQTTDASQGLVLQIETEFMAGSEVVLQLTSGQGAELIAERPLVSRHDVVANGSGPEANGVLKLSDHLRARRFYLREAARVWLDLPSRPIEAPIIGTQGTFLVEQDVDIDQTFFMFSGELVFAQRGEQSARVRTDSLTRAGSVELRASEAGHLILQVAGLPSYAGKTPATSIRTGARTVVELTGDQEAPRAVADAAGIHGEGTLVIAPPEKTAEPLIIGMQNTHTGGTTLRHGTVRLASVEIPEVDVPNSPRQSYTGTLGPGPLTIAAEAVLELAGTTQRVESLAGAGTIRLGGGTLEVMTSSTFTGAVEGPGAITINGETTRY